MERMIQKHHGNRNRPHPIQLPDPLPPTLTIRHTKIVVATMIQAETPAALMGRVGSTVMSLVFTAQILGLVLSGLLANHIGVRQVFTICALLLALIAAGKLLIEPKPTIPATT